MIKLGLRLQLWLHQAADVGRAAAKSSAAQVSQILFAGVDCETELKSAQALRFETGFCNSGGARIREVRVRSPCG